MVAYGASCSLRLAKKCWENDPLISSHTHNIYIFIYFPLQDPFNTSAWNALTDGHKLWALYPPSVSHVPGNNVDGFDYGGHSARPADWWTNVYPYLREDRKPLSAFRDESVRFAIPIR